MYKNTIGRRQLLSGLAGTTGLGLAGSIGLIAGGGLSSTAAAQSRSIGTAGTFLVLLGTQGGPSLTLQRNESSNAIVVDGRIYLVDCGYGALGAIRESGLNFREIGQIFLTHLHDDHTSDVAALLSHQWTGGRVEPTTVIGPYGTERLVEAALAFTEANAAIRLADEDRSVAPADVISGRDIEVTARPTEIFADDRVTVSSVENTHFSDSAKEKFPYRAVSYRIDSRDRSITVSGDTAYSENLVRLAEGSDVLVCESMELSAHRANFDQRVAAGAYADNPEGVWNHIVETHLTTEESGRIAAEAGVSTLVLTHLIPGGLSDLPDEAYIEGVRRHFDGEVIVGQDLMVI